MTASWVTREEVVPKPTGTWNQLEYRNYNKTVLFTKNKTFFNMFYILAYSYNEADLDLDFFFEFCFLKFLIIFLIENLFEFKYKINVCCPAVRFLLIFCCLKKLIIAEG